MYALYQVNPQLHQALPLVTVHRKSSHPDPCRLTNRGDERNITWCTPYLLESIPNILFFKHLWLCMTATLEPGQPSFTKHSTFRISNLHRRLKWLYHMEDLTLIYPIWWNHQNWNAHNFHSYTSPLQSAQQQQPQLRWKTPAIGAGFSTFIHNS